MSSAVQEQRLFHPNGGMVKILQKTLVYSQCDFLDKTINFVSLSFLDFDLISYSSSNLAMKLIPMI